MDSSGKVGMTLRLLGGNTVTCYYQECHTHSSNKDCVLNVTNRPRSKSTITLRISYVLLMVITIALGLASRSQAFTLPIFVVTYAGDTLWALMVYWGMRALLPYQSIYRTIALALLFSFAIEFLQLYQAPWINSIRSTTLGALVLGICVQY